MILHHKQIRKGTNIPYVTHLWTVAALVGEHGGDEDQIIGALLHDAIEDQGDKIPFAMIQERFGTRVEDIVQGCTDAETIPKQPWMARKEQNLVHLITASTELSWSPPPTSYIMVVRLWQTTDGREAGSGLALMREVKTESGITLEFLQL